MGAYSRILLPWDSQPQEAANVIAGKYSAVWVGSNPSRELVKSYSTTNTSTITRNPTAQGIAAGFTNATNERIKLADDADSILGANGTIALFRRVRSPAAGGTFKASYGYSAGASDRVLLHAPDDAGTTLYFDWGNATTGSGSGAGRLAISYTRDTEWETLVCVAGQSKGREVWRRGVRIGSSGGTFARTATAQPFYLGAFDGTVNSDNVDVALLAVSAYEWSDAEIVAWCQNPYGETFAPQTIWVPVSAGGGGDTTISATLGTATADGFTANINANRTIAATLGTAAASGFTAVVNANTTIAGTLGTAVASGFDATITAASTDTVINCNLGTATASGFNATIVRGWGVSADLGTAVASGFDASILSGAPVQARRHAGGFPRREQFRKGYLIKGRRYFLTEDELAVHIATMLQEVSRGDVKEITAGKPKVIPRKVWEVVKPDAIISIAEDDDEEAILMLM